MLFLDPTDRSQNFPARLLKSIQRAEPIVHPDLHGYSCAIARELMAKAFAKELPQLLEER